MTPMGTFIRVAKLAKGWCMRNNCPNAVGRRTTNASLVIIGPGVRYTSWLVVHNRQSGVVTKHPKLVLTVTTRATPSSPAALRVHTAADANVQGTLAAISMPRLRSSRISIRMCNCTHIHARMGMPIMLIIIANSAGAGCRTAPQRRLLSRLKDIRNRTMATAIRLSTHCVPHLIPWGKQTPEKRTMARKIRNQ